MRRILCGVIISVLLLGLVSCSAMDQSVKLAVCGSYSVPGMMCPDLKGGTFSCEVIERDSYDRILFVYSSYNLIEETDTAFYVICQKIDAESVFFYEDVCYSRYSDDIALIEGLKDSNDWNKPLELEKMSHRPLTVSLDLVIQTNTKPEIKNVKKTFCELNSINGDDISDSFLIDANNEGQSLYVFCVNKDGNSERFLVLCNSDYRMYWMSFTGSSGYEKEFVCFKQENGWIYG